jgi:hypothetical protein
LIWIAIAIFVQSLLLMCYVSILEKSRRKHTDMFFGAICSKLGIAVRGTSTDTAPPKNRPADPAPQPPSPEELLQMLMNPSEGEAREAYDELKQHPQHGHIYRPWNDPDV